MEKPTQIAEINETFLDLVKKGVTKQALIKNIKRHPMLWSQFSRWIDKLPDNQEVWEEKELIYEQFMQSGAYYDTDSETYKSKLYEAYLRNFRPLGEQP
jgi:hypothetical protein